MLEAERLISVSRISYADFTNAFFAILALIYSMQIKIFSGADNEMPSVEL
jgi:hypothetical protein